VVVLNYDGAGLAGALKTQFEEYVRNGGGLW